MKVFSLFELFLVVFALYAAFEFDGTTRITIFLGSLIIVLLFERLQKKLEEDEEAKKRFLKYRREEFKRKLKATQTQEEVLVRDDFEARLKEKLATDKKKKLLSS